MQLYLCILHMRCPSLEWLCTDWVVPSHTATVAVIGVLVVIIVSAVVICIVWPLVLSFVLLVCINCPFLNQSFFVVVCCLGHSVDRCPSSPQQWHVFFPFVFDNCLWSSFLVESLFCGSLFHFHCSFFFFKFLKCASSHSWLSSASAAAIAVLGHWSCPNPYCSFGKLMQQCFFKEASFMKRSASILIQFWWGMNVH